MYFEKDIIEPLTIEIDFALNKLQSFLDLTEGQPLDDRDLQLFASKFQYNDAKVRKRGNQTLFNVQLPLGSERMPNIVIKFYNQRITPEAIIQYVASFQYFMSQNIYFELELPGKRIIMRPASILYFAIYTFKLGKINREVPIIVQENIEDNYDTREYLERKDLSQYSKMMTKKGFTLDSFESNWKLLKIEEKKGKPVYYCSYIDILQCTRYENIKNFIEKIFLGLDQSIKTNSK